jgi:hypothetical protein
VTYISVPYTAWEPIPISTERRSHQAQTPPGTYGHPEGATTSLVQYNSITSTPSTIAKDSLIRMLDLPKSDPRHKYDLLCSEFVDYLDKCEQKGFMIKGYDTVKGKILNLPMSYDNRWGPSRRQELSEKLKRLEFWFEMQEDRPVTMATLTSYHPADETVGSSWFKLNQARGKFLKMIKKYCGKDTDYFWVPEPHPSSDTGYVHYHIAIFADIPIELENKLRNLWSEKYKVGSHTYGLDFSTKQNKDSKIRSLKNYLSKYLEKGFLLKEWSTGLLIFNATLWDTGFRMYGASTPIRKMMNIKDEKDNHIVWLETRMQTIEITPEGEEVEIDKVIWYRQYIPDWIDSDFWLDKNGELRVTEPPPQYIYDWGRRTKDRSTQDEYPARTPDEWRRLRKRQQDGYL